LLAGGTRRPDPRLDHIRRSVGGLIRSDRRWHFEADPPTVWAAMTDHGSYRSWWPWLSRLDADAFAPGERWRCTVQPPLPYTLRFTLQLDAVEAPRFAAATVSGDITGTARVSLEPDGDGTAVRLESELAPANPFLRGVARVAFPVVRFGHDWVLDAGARQFRGRALG
jgi:hypothetical protein